MAGRRRPRVKERLNVSGCRLRWARAGAVATCRSVQRSWRASGSIGGGCGDRRADQIPRARLVPVAQFGLTHRAGGGRPMDPEVRAIYRSGQRNSPKRQNCVSETRAACQNRRRHRVSSGDGLGAVWSAIESSLVLAGPQFLRKVACSPLQSTSGFASHARGRRFESSSAHHVNQTATMD